MCLLACKQPAKCVKGFLNNAIKSWGGEEVPMGGAAPEKLCLLTSHLMIWGPGQPPLESLCRREWLHVLLAAPKMPAGHWAQLGLGHSCLLLGTGRDSLQAADRTSLPFFSRGGCPGNGPGTEDLGTSGTGRGRIHRRPSWGPCDAGLCVGRDGRLCSAHPGGQAGPGVSGGCRESAEVGPGGCRAAGERSGLLLTLPQLSCHPHQNRSWQKGSCGCGHSDCPPHLPPWPKILPESRSVCRLCSK